MAKMIQADVATPCGDYNEMAKKWDLINDLMGGTAAMRAAGEKWLPREEKEDYTKWKARLDRSILYEGYKDTLESLSGKPFSRDVTIGGELPEKLADIENNADGEGTSLTQFAREVFKTAINRGLTHVLVNYPRTIREDGRYMSLAEERKNSIQPRFLHITPDQLIRFRCEKAENGTKRLTEIAWRDSKVVPDGAFGEKTIDYVYVYKTDVWEIYEKPQDVKEWPSTPKETGKQDFPGGIPLVTFYINKTGFMTGEPILEKLAWLNLEHWQSSSDQRNILHYARAGVLFIKGITDEEKQQNILVGPNAVFKTENADADMMFVEHTGGAIEKGAEDIKRIEERMEVMGMQPVLTRTGQRTATERSIDKGDDDCDLQTWSRGFEVFLEHLYQYAAMWTNDEIPEDFEADVYNDFGLSLRTNDDLKLLQADALANRCTKKTYLTEAKRRGLYSENLDVEDELKAIEDETPDLGTLGQEEDNLDEDENLDEEDE